MLKFKNTLFKTFIELFVFNKKKRKIIKARWAKKHLEKYVNKAIKETLNTNYNTDDDKSEKIIWQYWHQGFENAPELMKKCLNSVKKQNPDSDIRVLSFETIKDYVQIPEKYYELLAKKKIPIAIFSDILRLYLLSKYGGTWIDSTILFTSKLPKEIEESDFCVLQKNEKEDSAENKMTCYFIHSKKDNYFLHVLKNAIENYWKENDFVINYFMFEHIATMLSNKNKDLEKIWNNMPYYTALNASQLLSVLYKPFSLEKYNEIKEKSFMHKLTWKTLKNNPQENSFYDSIIKGQ